MKCFIIMPYASRFRDPLEAIRRSVNRVREPVQAEAVRMDDHQVAGRITQQLEQALRDADLCIADISPSDPAHPNYANPNVMWEIGYAMALGKMPILISQGDFALPFDLHDVTHIRYDRERMHETLEEPLTRAVQATAQYIHANMPLPGSSAHAMQNSNSQLHEIVQAIVESPAFRSTLRSAMHDAPAGARTSHTLDARDLVGAWVEQVTGSHAYIAVVDGQLIAPYCYAGDDHLAGVYFDWKTVNGMYYARYQWATRQIRGFSFLRPTSSDVMTGAWWYDGQAKNDIQIAPDPATGWAAEWRRNSSGLIPLWAKNFTDRVRRDGLEQVMASFTGGD